MTRITAGLACAGACTPKARSAAIPADSPGSGGTVDSTFPRASAAGDALPAVRLGVGVFGPTPDRAAPPDTLVLRAGVRAPLRVQPLDARGRSLTVFDQGVTYASSSPAVAAVDDSGMLHTVREGRAVVSASMAWRGSGSLRGRVVVRVKPATEPYARLAEDARANVDLSGHYTTGFEASAFRPCEWVEDYHVPSLDSVPRVRAVLDSIPREFIDLRYPAGPWRPKTVFVHWRGVITETGPYMPMQSTGRAFIPTGVREVRTPTPSDCR